MLLGLVHKVSNIVSAIDPIEDAPAFVETWLEHRPGNPNGYTCCQEENLFIGIIKEKLVSSPGSSELLNTIRDAIK